MDPATVGPYLGALVALVGSYLAYRRGDKADQAKAASTKATGAVSGFEKLVEGLQAELKRVNAGLAACQRRESEHVEHALEQDRKIGDLTRQHERMATELARLKGIAT